MPVKNLVSKILLSVLFGIAVMALFTLYADVRSLQATLRSLEWIWMIPVIGLTAINLGLRYLKWEYYLSLLGIRGVSRSDSIAIFLSNFLLVLTPGKVGTLLKSYFLKQTNGIPLSRTMPIVLAERLTDGLGMVVMTAIALVAFPAALPAVAIVFVTMGTVVIVAQNRPLALRLIRVAEGLPLLKRFAATLHSLYDSASELLQVRPLIIATLLGTGARATEGVALYLILLSLSVPNMVTVLANALFITALSNIIGVLVMMPGGLGGTEASMAGLISRFIGLALAPATAATLLARLASFWLPALLGAVALFIKRARFFRAGEMEVAPPQADAIASSAPVPDSVK